MNMLYYYLWYSTTTLRAAELYKLLVLKKNFLTSFLIKGNTDELKNIGELAGTNFYHMALKLTWLEIFRLQVINILTIFFIVDIICDVPISKLMGITRFPYIAFILLISSIILYKKLRNVSEIEIRKRIKCIYLRKNHLNVFKKYINYSMHLFTVSLLLLFIYKILKFVNNTP